MQVNMTFSREDAIVIKIAPCVEIVHSATKLMQEFPGDYVRDRQKLEKA